MATQYLYDLAKGCGDFSRAPTASLGHLSTPAATSSHLGGSRLD
jgi:hypothetical protein